MLDLTLTNEQKVRVSVKPVTDAGKIAKLDGPPEWKVLSGPATMEVDADGLSAVLITSDDDLSDTVFQISADADLGSGVETIQDTVTLHATGVRATSLGLSADAPETK